MTSTLFPSDGIESIHFKENCCYTVKDLIVDTRGPVATFWHGGKRLVKFLNRDLSYRLQTNNYTDETHNPFGEIEVIDEPLFLFYDDLNGTSGHFFVDSLP